MKDTKNIEVARMLRRNMTDVERILWSKIRNKQLGVKFRRQQPLGKYIVDFICFEERLIIEVDGGQHSENTQDTIRDKWLKTNGFQVLRFWNNDVLKNLNGVLGIIKKYVSPSP